MAQVQLQLECYRSHQADTWRGAGGGKRIIVINSRALAKTSCYQSRFRFHYLTILVLFPRVHPLRLDHVPALLLLSVPKRPSLLKSSNLPLHGM